MHACMHVCTCVYINIRSRMYIYSIYWWCFCWACSSSSTTGSSWCFASESPRACSRYFKRLSTVTCQRDCPRDTGLTEDEGVHYVIGLLYIVVFMVTCFLVLLQHQVFTGCTTLSERKHLKHLDQRSLKQLKFEVTPNSILHLGPFEVSFFVND